MRRATKFFQIRKRKFFCFDILLPQNKAVSYPNRAESAVLAGDKFLKE